jgi:hypothetical protein
MLLARTLFFLAGSLLAPKETVDASSVWETAQALAEVVEELPPVYDGPEGRERTALLLWSMAYHESRWDPWAYNPTGGDTGIVQVRALWFRGHARDEILGDARLGFELGLRALLDCRKACGGTTTSWLGAYASGKCGGARSKVLLRCAPLGLCDQR